MPDIISFVTGAGGRVLDGTGLDTTFARIDDDTPCPPLGYMVNCA